MSIYIDQKIEDSSSGALKTLLSWHKNILLLAVASYSEDKGAGVTIYQDNGSIISSSISPRCGLQVTCLEWHPSKKILFVGWESGDICVWNNQGNDTYDFQNKHTNVLCAIRCSENGNCLVTGDIGGTCIGWKVDLKGMLTVLFVQELKESITDITFRKFCLIEQEEEISRLAQAAVSGDERALNLFSEWKPLSQTQGNKVSISFSEKEKNTFFVGCLSGVVYYFNENGNSEDVLQMETSIRYLLHYKDRDMLIVVTESLILAQYHVSFEGTLTEFSKIKLSGRKTEISVMWAGEGVLAVCTGERVIHLWNVNTGHNNALSLDDSTTTDTSDIITSISFQPRKGILSAGTNHGQVLIWKISYEYCDRLNEEMWQIEHVLKFQGSVRSLEWYQSSEILGVITATDVYLVTEQDMSFTFKDQISAVQLTARQVAIESQLPDVTVHLLTDVQIKAVFLSGNFVALSAGKKLMFYEVSFSERKTKHIGSFFSESRIVALHEQTAYVVDNLNIEIRTFQGTLKQTLSFLEIEGYPLAIDVCGDYLASATDKAIVKVWDLSRREAKLHFGPRSIEGSTKEEQIVSIKCNHKGNKVSVTMKKKTRTDFVPDSILYILDTDSDMLYHFDFGKGKPMESQPVSSNTTASPVHHMVAEIERLIAGRYPVNNFWVIEDPRLIICEAKLMPLPLKKHKMHDADFQAIFRKQNKFSSFTSEIKHESMIVSLYVAPEQGLLIQDYFFLGPKQTNLLGVHIPYYYILKKIEPSEGIFEYNTSNAMENHTKQDTMKQYNSLIDRRVMRDFVGMEDCDKVTKEALMMFSYFLTVGNMDEAFKAIKVIKTQSVWNNMARMCVKTKRLDVAKVCLGKMGHVRGSMALQEVEKETNVDVRVAVLAIHLGMLDDAENLLIGSSRFDVLNLFYQDSGRWEKALEVAEKHDRIHLRNTFYNYAQHLEFKGDISGAIAMYEKAEVHAFEIPRMLYGKRRTMETYVMNSKSPDIHRWWAQYLESVDEMESSLQFYESAKDYWSLVRLYCYCNNLEKAAEIANETGDRAACFYIGRQFENQDNIKEAIHFFTRAAAYTNAIRICKEHGLDDQLMNLALMSGPEEMANVARYYEQQESQQEKAILLYHKAGLLTKAMELAFKAQEHNALLSIATGLSHKASPELLLRCAYFFIEAGKYDKAVDIFTLTDRHAEALDLCLDHNITITEELAEKLTLPKNHNDPSLRTEILEKIGECCVFQENYHLAAKKYTQAGDKVKAMKALLKSGDTEKIIFFTGVSRQREIYIMAANYLQSLGWRHDPDIMKNILAFYTKAKSFDHLVTFYEACAQVEIDEYQNYEKAQGALIEACKWLSRVENSDNATQLVASRIQNLKIKTELVKQFVEIMQLYLNRPDDAIKKCQDLLQIENVEIAIRRGDIYGFLVEHFCRLQNYEAAYSAIAELKTTVPDANLPCYVKSEHLSAIHNALQIDPNYQGLELKGENYESELSDDDYQATENGY